MNWLTSIFGSVKSAETAVETAAKGIYNGVDKGIFTKEEASDAYFRLMEMAYDDNSFRSITRRWLVWGITAWVLVNAQIALILEAGFGLDTYTKTAIDIADKFWIGEAFAAGVAFYFLRTVLKGGPSGGRG